MTNQLIDAYQQGRLPASLIVVADRQTSNRLVEEFIDSLALNPADCQLLTEATTIKIAEARAVRQFACQSRFTSPIKLVYIAEAAQLTHEAANALLKILEEPPDHTHFILATTRPDSLLPTVRSRCQLFRLDSTPAAPNGSIALPKNLAEAFQLSQQLAAADQPLTSYFHSWLTDLNQEPKASHWAKQQSIILKYLQPAQTSANRRLLLDNFFLDLYREAAYNTD